MGPKRPTQCVSELHLTVADSLAPLPINNNNNKIFQAISNCGKQKRSTQIFRELSGVFQQDFKGTKISAVLEPRTGQFSRIWGFEAKAKDFKMRPRGQRRPRGFHLCPPLQNPCVLATVLSVSKGCVPMRSDGSVDHQIELLSGLT